ncbi:MAG: hypothetical protein ACU0CO_06720, partial [Shimia sp.]
TCEADQLKLLGRAVEPVDGAVAQAGAQGLKVFVDGAEAVPAVAGVIAGLGERAERGAKGKITFCLLDPSLPGEVEMDLGDALPVSPAVKSALKSLGGVAFVEDM